MSPIDIVILVLAALAVGTLIYKKARTWKHGGCAGCNGCDSCAGCNGRDADCANCAHRETKQNGK